MRESGFGVKNQQVTEPILAKTTLQNLNFGSELSVIISGRNGLDIESV